MIENISITNYIYSLGLFSLSTPKNRLTFVSIGCILENFGRPSPIKIHEAQSVRRQPFLHRNYFEAFKDERSHSSASITLQALRRYMVITHQFEGRQSFNHILADQNFIVLKESKNQFQTLLFFALSIFFISVQGNSMFKIDQALVPRKPVMS